MVADPSTDETYDDEGFFGSLFSGTKMYIVIACIAALVLLALVQASCTIYKMSKKSASQKVRKLITLEIRSITTIHYTLST